jgi:phosphatidylglycerophosphatase A
VAIKESSDELNAPQIASAAAVPTPRPVRSPKDYLALAIATCGVGYLPLAPGTWGSLVGIVVYLLVRYLVFHPYVAPLFGGSEVLGSNPFLIFVFQSILVLLVIAISIAGAWAATRVELLTGRKDASVVVIDEVAGQLFTFFIVLEYLAPRWIVLGFILFRFFDIVKPFPARQFEAMAGGVGVVGDDLIAGLYGTWALAVVMIISSLI